MERYFKIIADFNHLSGNADKVGQDNFSCLKQEGFRAVVVEIPENDLKYVDKYKKTGSVEWLLLSETLRNNQHAFNFVKLAVDKKMTVYGFDPIDKQLDEIIKQNFPDALDHEYAEIEHNILSNFHENSWSGRIIDFINLAREHSLDYAGAIYQSIGDLIDKRSSASSNVDLANDILANVKENKILIVYGAAHLNQPNDLDEALKGEVFYLGDDMPTDIKPEPDWHNISLGNKHLCRSRTNRLPTR